MGLDQGRRLVSSCGHDVELGGAEHVLSQKATMLFVFSS